MEDLFKNEIELATAILFSGEIPIHEIEEACTIRVELLDDMSYGCFINGACYAVGQTTLYSYVNGCKRFYEELNGTQD